MYQILCVILFGMGTVGCYLNRRNFQIMLQCIEVMLLSVNLVFLTGSVTVDDLNGQQMRLWVLTAAAAETAQGQALCVLYFRLRSTQDVELIGLMKGSNSTLLKVLPAKLVNFNFIESSKNDYCYQYFLFVYFSLDRTFEQMDGRLCHRVGPSSYLVHCSQLGAFCFHLGQLERKCFQRNSQSKSSNQPQFFL